MRYQYTVLNLLTFPFILYWTEVIYYYKSYFPLFTIILNNLILYQKCLNERRRTTNIFAVACLFQFCSIAFYLVSIILFWKLVSISISKVFFLILHYCLNFLVPISPKKQQNFFSDQLGTSANNSSSFFVHRLALFVVLPFLTAMIAWSNLSSYFLW